MKRLLFLTTSLFLMAATCQKTTSNNSMYIRGKVSHRSCATIAVQVLDAKYNYLGDEKWQQSPENPVIENVFSVSNPCSFPADYKPGDTFYFTILEEDPTNKDCATCKLFDNPPKKKHLVKVIVADKE